MGGRIRQVIAALAAGALLAGCASRPAAPPTRAWQQPCDACVPGVVNFTKVNEKLWRGAQPDAEGFRRLAEAGVKTVIDLRHDHDDFTQLQSTGVHYLWVPMRAWHPETEDMVLVLAALRRAFADPARWPVYVHCAEGKDRTGYVIATYRIVEDKWSADDAISEMFDFRYNPVWFGNPAFLRGIERRRGEIEARVARTP